MVARKRRLTMARTASVARLPSWASSALASWRWTPTPGFGAGLLVSSPTFGTQVRREASVSSWRRGAEAGR